MMYLERLAGLSIALLALGAAAGPSIAAGTGTAPANKIVRSVEKLADTQAASPAADGDMVCRWATQSLTYQGVSHTRRVRVCAKRTWWDELVRKAKASTSKSRPRPG